MGLQLVNRLAKDRRQLSRWYAREHDPLFLGTEDSQRGSLRTGVFYVCYKGINAGIVSKFTRPHETQVRTARQSVGIHGEVIEDLFFWLKLNFIKV